jgi:hypothetical protein
MILDHACGSGSLLLRAKKKFDAHIIEEGFFGQEVNHTTYKLARMNMLLALFDAVESVADYRSRGPVVEGDVCIIDDNGEKRPFVVQLFNSSYQTLAFVRGLAVKSATQIYMGPA